MTHNTTFGKLLNIQKKPSTGQVHKNMLTEMYTAGLLKQKNCKESKCLAVRDDLTTLPSYNDCHWKRIYISIPIDIENVHNILLDTKKQLQNQIYSMISLISNIIYVSKPRKRFEMRFTKI